MQNGTDEIQFVIFPHVVALPAVFVRHVDDGARAG